MLKKKLASIILLITISTGIAYTNFTSAKAMIPDSSDYSDDNNPYLSDKKNFKDRSLVSLWSGLTMLRGYRDLFEDITNKIYDKYKHPWIVSFVKILGEGQYNVVAEIKIDYDNKNPKALRINKRTDKLQNIREYECKFLPQIELMGDSWLITPKYFNLKRLFKKIEEKNFLLEYLVDENFLVDHPNTGNFKEDNFKKKKPLIDYLICCYAESMYNIIGDVHATGVGVFDWKISNFCFSFEGDSFRIIFCDIDFTNLDRNNFYHTHRTGGLHPTKDNSELDIKIAIKDIHDLIKTIGSGDSVKSYEDFLDCRERWEQILQDLNKINHPANKWINLMLQTINERMIRENNTNVENLEFIPIIKSFSAEIDNDMQKEDRERLKKFYKPINYSQLIKVPFQRILPPPISCYD